MIAKYTERLIEEFDRNGQATIEFGPSDRMTAERARSRLHNAANRAGLIVETRLERDSMAGFGPPTGGVIATVVGWRP